MSGLAFQCNKQIMGQNLKVTHLLHGELFKDRVILVEPKPAEPVQDAILLWSVGLGLARCLSMRLGTGLGV